MFVPLAPTSTSLKIVNTLQVFHLLDFSPPCVIFLIIDKDLDFSLDCFRSSLIQLFHLLVEGPSNMVFEHFQDSFDAKDLANGFP
jgi:hypothetical protein